MNRYGPKSRKLWLLVVLLALSGCYTADVKAAMKKQGAAPPPTVTVMTVGRRTVPIYRDFTAQTQATQAVDIKARVEGTLQSEYFSPGTLVHKGDVLFQIDPSQYQATLQSAQASLLKAKADLFHATSQVSVLTAEANVQKAKADLANATNDVHRFTPLAAAKAVSQLDLDNARTREQINAASLAQSEASLRDTQLNTQVEILSARASVQSAQAAVTNAQINLGYTTIHSPVTGIVGLIQVDPGNLVGHGDATLLTTVQSVDPIRVQFTLTEDDYLTLVRQGYKVGSPVLGLILANDATYPYKGKFYALNNVVDPKTGTISVQADFPNPKAVLRPGQFARVRINVSEQKGAIVIPQAAVVELQGASTVRVLNKDNEVEQRSVSLGPVTGESFVVLSGLSPGDRIVVDGVEKAMPGTIVNPVEQTAAR